MRVLLLGLALGLAACGGGGKAQDAEDLADEAYAEAARANGRIEDLEARLDALESDLGDERSAREAADMNLENQVRNHMHY
jgi:hypothetical protein